MNYKHIEFHLKTLRLELQSPEVWINKIVQLTIYYLCYVAKDIGK